MCLRCTVLKPMEVHFCVLLLHDLQLPGPFYHEEKKNNDQRIYRIPTNHGFILYRIHCVFLSTDFHRYCGYDIIFVGLYS